MGPKVVRTLKGITFECFPNEVRIYYIGINDGIQVSKGFSIDGKLEVKGSGCSFIFSNPGPEWYLSTRLIGGTKHFVIHHPDVNLGTSEAPIYETPVPAKIVRQVSVVTEEKVIWSY